MSSDAVPGPLHTDLYQLTMAYGYWKHGLADREACFHAFFRECPFGGAYVLACGLANALAFLDGFRFRDEDLDYLETLEVDDGARLFEPAFLDHLAALRLRCDVDAMPEGTAAFPHEPLLRVTGPLLEAQLLETPLLNLVNFPSLVATKAARIADAAQGDAVLEFGLRRAQGVDGALTASRASYVGGCAATSNLLAGQRYGIPVKGTHAHSWIMAFEDEREAFDRYADALPHGCILLVDTYDTLAGVRRAVETGRRLRARGHELAGVRLDSGDLAALARESRRILDEAGFEKTAIVGSGDLDEYAIADLKRRGAPITVWGVGTKLATAYDEPALGGVYKLAALRDARGRWSDRLKLSDDPAKASDPGVLQVRRYRAGDTLERDVIYDASVATPDGGEDVLVPAVRDGRRVLAAEDTATVRERARAERDALPPAVRRLDEPERYPVALEPRLAERKRKLQEEMETMEAKS